MAVFTNVYSVQMDVAVTSGRHYVVEKRNFKERIH